MLDLVGGDCPDPIKSGTPLRPEDIAAMCQGKAAFTSAHTAHKAARRRKGLVRDVYRCRNCNCWHIGSPVEKRTVYRSTSSGVTKWGKQS